MSKPEISVVLPTYNRAEFLPRAIEGIRNQEFQDLELIVVDDGSNDRTKQVIENQTELDIKYLKHYKNQGVAKARNTGIGASSGNYIAFLDSDDYWKPEKLSAQYEQLSNSPRDTKLCYVKYQLKSSKRFIPVNEWINRDGFIRQQLLIKNFVPSQVLVEKECLVEAGGFDSNFPPVEDWELWLRLSEQYKFKYISQPLVIYDPQDDSISRNQSRRKNSVQKLFNKYQSDIKPAFKNQLEKRFNHYEKATYNRYVFIWGTGKAGQHAREFLRNAGLSNNLEGFIDSDPSCNKLRDLPVLSPNKFKTKQFNSPIVLIESQQENEIHPVADKYDIEYMSNVFRPITTSPFRKLLGNIFSL